MTTAHNIRRIGLARVRGEHLVPANQPLDLPAAPPMPARIASEPEAIHLARLAAIRRLGTAWTMHPAYVFNPRHSRNPGVYAPARTEYLERVAQLAAAARQRNPLWHEAERVRAALQPQERQP